MFICIDYQKYIIVDTKSPLLIIRPKIIGIDNDIREVVVSGGWSQELNSMSVSYYLDYCLICYNYIQRYTTANYLLPNIIDT